MLSLRLKKYLEILFLFTSVLGLLFTSGCSYQLTGKEAYSFKTARVGVQYEGRYFSVPAYFKPALKEELKYRVDGIKFKANADLDMKINIIAIELEPIGITYLASHPTANSYLLKITFKYLFKTEKYEKGSTLTRLRNFSSGLNTSQTSVASISKDYKFKEAMKSLARDISREIVNNFLSSYSNHQKIAKVSDHNKETNVVKSNN